MCYASEDKITQAKRTQSNANCPQCSKPLSSHTTTSEIGLKLIQGTPDTKVKKGDVLMHFSNTMDAETFANTPFWNRPGDQPVSQTFIASGFVGKTLDEVAGSSDFYTVAETFVVVRRVAPKPVGKTSTRSSTSKTNSTTTPTVTSQTTKRSGLGSLFLGRSS